jgi:hypothetical protein
MRKILITPLLCSFAVVSCGKKIENTNTNTGDDTVILNEANASNVKLELSFNKNGELKNSVYKFGAEAWIKVPEAIFLKSGTSFTYSTRIYFNSSNSITLENTSELYCDYTAVKQITNTDQPTIDGYNHIFNSCHEDVNGDGVPEKLYYEPGDEVPQDLGRYIKIKHIGSSTDSVDATEVYSDIEVDWR